MLYSFEYTRNFSYDNEDNIEYWINYDGDDSQVFNFLDFIQHKIVIKINEENLIDFFTEDKIKLYKDYSDKNIDKDFVFRISYGEYGKILSQKMKEIDLKFFFDRAATTWDELQGLINYGVSEIYICEELGFNIKTVSQICKEKDIKVRVYPNICQVKIDNLDDKLKTFFIRPDDIDTYSKYVDVLEFWGPKHTYNVMYETYYKNKYWYGDLSEIIIGLDKFIDNRCIIPEFGELRSKCGKKCYQNRPCKICEAIEDLAKVLNEKDLIITKS